MFDESEEHELAFALMKIILLMREERIWIWIWILTFSEVLPSLSSSSAASWVDATLQDRADFPPFSLVVPRSVPAFERPKLPKLPLQISVNSIKIKRRSKENDDMVSIRKIL
jgi:hypothetical protein